MTTVRELVTDSLAEIGVLADGETAASGDASLALRVLNRWLDSQSLDRLQIFTTTRSTLSTQTSVSEYFIGSAAGDYTDGFDYAWTLVPDNWIANTTGDGTISNDTTVYQAGGHAIGESVTSSGTVSVHQDFLMRSGDGATLSLYGRHGLNTAGVVTVQNLDTGKYLTSAGAWQVASANVITFASASFTLYTETFDIESAADVGAVTTTLRVQFRVDDSALSSAHFDTFSLVGETTLSIPRPVFLDHVNLIDTSQSPDTETPLTMLTEDGWAAVTSKAQTSTIPTHWYYNPTYPFGTLTLWPVPTGTTYQLAIYAPQQVEVFATIDDTVSLPPGYERMIVKNLALELCPAFEKTPSPLLIQQASQAMGAVKKVNRRLAELDVSGGFGRRGGYNIWTDQ